MLRGRPFAPKGDAFERALEDWRALRSDDDAEFDREISLDARDVAPTVTWGVSPEQAAPIDAATPDPDADRGREPRGGGSRRACLYGPRAGNAAERHSHRSRLHRLLHQRRASRTCAPPRPCLAGRKAVVPGLVSPGSLDVKRRAEEEGLGRDLP